MAESPTETGAAEPLQLLTNDAATAIDRAAIASGIPGFQLMQNAGRAVVAEITGRYPPGRCLVLCGPGNNGGDGFVIASGLDEAGWKVRAAFESAWARAEGDAATARAGWHGAECRLEEADIDGHDLVVDALFGSGLTRDLDGIVLSVLRAVERSGTPLVAIDVPSGVDGSSGALRGYAPMADLTVTFNRLKLGHVLMPGRAHAGTIVCRDIGIPSRFVDERGPYPLLNAPPCWVDRLPPMRLEESKYDRGHLLVMGGPPSMTGASVLAATAAQATGAGLVTVLCDETALSAYAAKLIAVMTRVIRSPDTLETALADRRVRALVAGPGMGINPFTRGALERMLRTGKPMVLDADAITIIAAERERLVPLLHEGCVLTPHEGEFARLLDCPGSKLDRCAEAARRLQATVVLKGADTVIASPAGQVLINNNAPARLATAGSGDVLAGLIGGLLARGMPPLEAAGCGVWIHGHSATRQGPIASAADLIPAVPAIVEQLRPSAGNAAP